MVEVVEWGGRETVVVKKKKKKRRREEEERKGRKRKEEEEKEGREESGQTHRQTGQGDRCTKGQRSKKKKGRKRSIKKLTFFFFSERDSVESTRERLHWSAVVRPSLVSLPFCASFLCAAGTDDRTRPRPLLVPHLRPPSGMHLLGGTGSFSSIDNHSFPLAPCPLPRLAIAMSE